VSILNFSYSLEGTGKFEGTEEGEGTGKYPIGRKNTQKSTERFKSIVEKVGGVLQNDEGKMRSSRNDQIMDSAPFFIFKISFSKRKRLSRGIQTT